MDKYRKPAANRKGSKRNSGGADDTVDQRNKFTPVAKFKWDGSSQDEVEASQQIFKKRRTTDKTGPVRPKIVPRPKNNVKANKGRGSRIGEITMLAQPTASSETMEQRLLRVSAIGGDFDVRKAVRMGTGKPNWSRTPTGPNGDSLDDGSPNIQPVASLTDAVDNSAPWNKRPNKPSGPSRADRPKLGDLRRMALNSTVKRLERTRENIEFATEQVVQTEVLLQEETGFIELDEGERVFDVTQRKIKEMVDITAATKVFDLNLYKYGPYCLDYSRNGRHLLLGGRKGHVAVIEWLTKRLLCEINVMDSVYQVAWLHQETMFAVAQKDWLYIYDNQGIELHCLEKMRNILQMEFLPYHFLLATSNDKGMLQWLDITMGKMVSTTRTDFRRLDIMTQNPWNAVLVCGHHTGTVTMWSPTVNKPLVTMLCHPRPIRAVAIDGTGNYMATASHDGFVKLWDVRTLKALSGFKTKTPPTSLAFSQRGLLAVAMHNTVQVIKDSCTKVVESPYMCHSVGQSIRDLAYCPYEDVLGIGHVGGFSSILVPGASEANFDSLENNPFQTKGQRRHREVKFLLDKIQPELIGLDPSAITKIENIPLESDDMKESKVGKPTTELKNKTRGKSDSANLVRRKNLRQDKLQREFVRDELKKRKETQGQREEQPPEETNSINRVLNRFSRKT